MSNNLLAYTLSTFNTSYEFCLYHINYWFNIAYISYVFHPCYLLLFIAFSNLSARIEQLQTIRTLK